MAALLIVPLHDALRRRGLGNVWATLIGVAAYVRCPRPGRLPAGGQPGFLPARSTDLRGRAARDGGQVHDRARWVGGGAAGRPGNSHFGGQGLCRLGDGRPGDRRLQLAHRGVPAARLPRADDRLRWAFGDNTAAMERTRELANRLRTFVVARAVWCHRGGPRCHRAARHRCAGCAAVGPAVVSARFIPNVGFILSLVPPTILAFLTGGPGVALAMIIAYQRHQRDHRLRRPAALHRRRRRHIASRGPVSIVFWGGVLDGAGALLAVPLTLVAVALADAFEGSRPTRMLRGHDPAAPSSRAGGSAVSS